MTLKAMAPIASCLLFAFAHPAEAKRLYQGHAHVRQMDANGNAATSLVRSGKTDATARVSPSYAVRGSLELPKAPRRGPSAVCRSPPPLGRRVGSHHRPPSHD